MIIENCICFDGLKFLEGKKDIYLKNGKISRISDAAESRTGSQAADSYFIACPGFIDIHTHGMAGYDNSKLNSDEYEIMKNAYHKAGTTTFVPSFPTISSELMCSSLEMYLGLGAQIRGIHLEGPYINFEKRGAQNPVYIQKPDAKWFEKKYGRYADIIKRVTLAPELDDNLQLTRYLDSKGIKVSFGHTVCNSEKADEFFKATDSIATHMFNAMPAIHHRSPSITTVALNRDNVYCEIIPDMLHLHPEIIKMVFKIKGPEKTIIVSDSMLAAGLPFGEYNFSGLQVIVDEKGARLDSGNLAGSTITMAEGVKRAIECGIEPEYALAAATSTPAEAMGFQKDIGYIKEGMTADLLLLNSRYTVEKVIKNGIIT